MCRLQIKLGDRNVTEYAEHHSGDRSDHLEIPAYYLAEWVAENWWPLLWEPRKSEDEGDNASFLSRHSITFAQHGFALPKVMLVPMGKNVLVTASPRDVQFADVRFRHGGSVSPSREQVSSELSGFVSEVVGRLEATAVSGTCLQEMWSLIQNTDEEEAQFCRFIGALGVSPYDVSEGIASTVERLLPALGERLLMDVCLVSPAESFEIVARTAELALSTLTESSEVTLEPLNSIAVPADNFAVPAWRRGVRAAEKLRGRLGIKDTDPHGAARVFEALRMDLGRAATGQNGTSGQPAIAGAVERNDQSARIALLQQSAPQRKFAGARAIFAAWASEHRQERRLLTLAVTRDQQANRAFAAELTAPIGYIRSQTKGGKLSQSKIFEIASTLEIGPDVVSKHAANNGMLVNPI